MIDQVQLGAFDNAKAKEFTNELTDLYYKHCAYVHPSKRQIEEQLELVALGHAYGFETADELREIGRVLFRLYDMLLVIFFHGLGLGMAGDVFVSALDDEAGWKFHKGKYVKSVSKCFDYKHERQSRRNAVG